MKPAKAFEGFPPSVNTTLLNTTRQASHVQCWRNLKLTLGIFFIKSRFNFWSVLCMFLSDTIFIVRPLDLVYPKWLWAAAHFSMTMYSFVCITFLPSCYELVNFCSLSDSILPILLIQRACVTTNNYVWMFWMNVDRSSYLNRKCHLIPAFSKGCLILQVFSSISINIVFWY